MCHRFNSGMTVLVVTNCVLIGFKAFSTAGSSYPVTCPVTWSKTHGSEVIGPKQDLLLVFCEMVMLSNCLSNISVNRPRLVLPSALAREASFFTGQQSMQRHQSVRVWSA